MNEKLNLVEILKDCPKDTKLWSPLCGECEFESIEKGGKFIIHVRALCDRSILKFMEDGRYYDNGGVCVLFPSKDQLDWSKFQKPFNEGDVIYVRTWMYKWVSIFKKYTEDYIFTYTDINLDNNNFHGADKEEKVLCRKNAILEKRLATEEEKEKLFQAIKEHGYTWNAVTKHLDEVKVSKFDPATLKPFDRVLVRHGLTNKWHIGFFEKIDTQKPKYDTADGSYFHCIPYNEETMHLLGTADMEPEYYQVDEYEE